jgi:hypothetical protein
MLVVSLMTNDFRQSAGGVPEKRTHPLQTRGNMCMIVSSAHKLNHRREIRKRHGDYKRARSIIHCTHFREPANIMESSPPP